MTNHPNSDLFSTRRLGGVLLFVGLAITLFGIVLLVLDTTSETPDEHAVANSPTPTATPTAVVTQSATPSPTTTATPTATATATPTPTPPPLTSDDAATFFDNLVDALTAHDVDFLAANLHPDVTQRYGETTCTAYLSSVPAETSIQVRAIDGPSPWDWTTNDGFVATYAMTWSVEIERLAGSQTLVQVMHISEVDHRIVWFTDCGEPVGS